jgi:NADH-quinone oxidoreductase subunit N
VLLSLIGAFYYLRIIKTMIFDEPVDPTPIHTEPTTTVLLALNGIAAIGFGLLPDGLMTACREAILAAITT